MTTNTGIKFSRGDLWVAKFSYYESPTQYKMRPVLIVSNDLMSKTDQVVILSPVTSAFPRDRYDVQVDRREQSGLDRPSCIRTSKLTSLHKNFLKLKIGSLDKHDLDQVLLMCRAIFE